MSATPRAVDLHAKPSPHYTLRLAEAQSVLSQAAAQFAPAAPGQAATVVQASSLGAEDIVISHLINSLKLDIGIFVLETASVILQVASFKLTG
jgi:phosphoadenosine phosphosulfate reductase